MYISLPLLYKIARPNFKTILWKVKGPALRVGMNYEGHVKPKTRDKLRAIEITRAVLYNMKLLSAFTDIIIMINMSFFYQILI